MHTVPQTRTPDHAHPVREMEQNARRIRPGAIVGDDWRLCRVVHVQDDALILKPVVSTVEDEGEAYPRDADEVVVVTLGRNSYGQGMYMAGVVAVESHANGAFTAYRVVDLQLGDGGVRLTLTPRWKCREGKIEGRSFDCPAHRVMLIDGTGRIVEPEAFASGKANAEPKVVV